MILYIRLDVLSGENEHVVIQKNYTLRVGKAKKKNKREKAIHILFFHLSIALQRDRFEVWQC